MFNLIPIQLKEQIIRDYKERRIVLWFGGFFVLSVILFIFLLPTYVLVFFEEKNKFSETQFMKASSQFKKSDEVVGIITETNEQLRVLLASVPKTSATGSLQKVLEAKNSFIHITEIEYREKTATSSDILIRGMADKRDALKQFATALENQEIFLDVTLPISNFAKDKDIDFSISLTSQ
ncbi:MAG: hypothetical protein NTV02_01930 [Candidatus Zambryskibacteria bacterium]|nr:hypothetical protein [Candidatus Zambryskibacteria bacterium]